MSNNPQCYDLIGDIHGEADALRRLLQKIGYTEQQGVYRHNHRQVIFLGDFIDRGPAQREVIDIVKPMVEQGSALAVMGNHEFNAIAFATPDARGGFLREHSEKNVGQHKQFLAEYELHSADYYEVVEWFKTLPLWLELDNLRVVHACWEQSAIDQLRVNYDCVPQLDVELLQTSCDPTNWQYTALETLLKGKEIPLPGEHHFLDKDDNKRHHIRIRWWKQAATYREAFMGPAGAITHIPDDTIHGDHLVEYDHSERPVFLGHYWLEGDPEPLAPNIACLDYSVAKPGGKLVAYQWDGEQKLSSEKFVTVRR